jgi:TolB-like protein
MLLYFIPSAVMGAADDTDGELERFSDMLSKAVQESGRKKLAILDFTDLQNSPLEIGRYVSEQITVNLVSTKGGFKVVDRANLKSILDEHKLTTSGLVEPENARKLGQVSGVDALVLGNAIVLGDSIQLTAKVIATDTAEIVAASKGKLRLTSELKVLLGKSAVAETTPSDSSKTPKAETKAQSPAAAKTPEEVPNSQTIEPLQVIVKSVHVGTENSSSYANINFLLYNLSSHEVAVAFARDGGYNSATVLNRQGIAINYSEGTGISQGGYVRRQLEERTTVIGPGKFTRCAFKFYRSLDPAAAKAPPFQLQMSLDAAQLSEGRYIAPRTLEFLIDLKQ